MPLGARGETAMQVSVWTFAVLTLCAVGGCRQGEKAQGPLAEFAAAVESRALQCQTVQHWWGGSGPPYEQCSATFGDTVLLKVSDASRKVVLVALRWDRANEETYRRLLAALEARNRAGETIAPPLADHPGRLMTVWQFDNYFLSVRWEPTESRVYQAWMLGTFSDDSLPTEFPR